MTIREACQFYLERQNRRVGLMAGKGINQKTFSTLSQNLHLALGLNKRYARLGRPIDPDKKLGSLTAEDYERFVCFWCNRSNLQSERTALNYVDAFRQMISKLEIPTPRGFAAIFKVRLTEPPKIARYDPNLLRIFTRNPRPWARLITLLCLNCGYYQVDLARLRFQHVTDFDGNPYLSGDTFITRRRERTRHRNRFSTTTYLWPETYALMVKFRAPPGNPFGTYFLNNRGRPFTVKSIASVIDKVKRQHRLSGKISVKQFRKIGASQIKALAGSDAMHQYKANALNAADAPYIIEDYRLLTTALKQLREKLQLDDLLPP